MGRCHGRRARAASAALVLAAAGALLIVPAGAYRSTPFGSRAWLRPAWLRGWGTPERTPGGDVPPGGGGSGTGHTGLPPLAQAKAAFVKAHPEYGYSGWLDANWRKELGSRMPPGDHYIDFTGSGLYTNSQLAAASAELASKVFGNPHCTSPSALLVDEELSRARDMVLDHFSADPAEYAVVFTRSATEALKLVGESFPWSGAPGWAPPRRVTPGGVNETYAVTTPGCSSYDPRAAARGQSNYVYLRANHKSVLGISGYARERGAAVACVDEDGMNELLSAPARVGGEDDEGSNDEVAYSLVAFPAKDNYEGRLYPLAWVDKVRALSTPRHKWLSVVDAAAFVPTHPLNLSEVKPDFVPISFYKMVGLPTGVGALLLRRAAAPALHVTYWGGGSVLDATAEGGWRMLMPFPEGLETGTMPFLDIITLKHGFALLNGPLGGMHAINAHVASLREWTWGQLSALRHSNGAPLLRVFGDHAGGPHVQSGLFQFVVLAANGSAHSAPQVQNDASAAGLHLRSGCHCNPGQCLHDLGIRPEEERERARAGDLGNPFITVMRRGGEGGGKLMPVVLPTGSVRASLGSLSTFEDVYALVAFLGGTYLE